MKDYKLRIVELPENFLHIEAYKNMQIWLKNLYKNMQDDDTLWLKFNYLYYKKVIELVRDAGFINHLDNWLITENKNGERQDYFHLTKKLTGYIWNKVEFKREVVVPYKVGGQPRGWFEDEDGRPVRYTGIGNCIYASDILNKYSFADLIFILTSSNKGDYVDLQNRDSYFLAHALGRKVDDDTINDMNVSNELNEAIKKIVGEF